MCASVSRYVCTHKNWFLERKGEFMTWAFPAGASHHCCGCQWLTNQSVILVWISSLHLGVCVLIWTLRVARQKWGGFLLVVIWGLGFRRCNSSHSHQCYFCQMLGNC